MSRLSSLEIENLMSVRHVVIAPKERGITTIGGMNGAGKSVTINAVDYLFGGADTHPPEPIRIGEETARVIGETLEFKATRRWWRTPEGVKTELKVVSKVDGQTFGSPQKMFDAMYPVDSDPTAFFRLKGAERRAWLLKVVGVDPVPLEKQIQKVFDARTLVNAELKSAEARLKAMSTDKPPPPIDTAALLKERGDLSTAQQLGARLVAERNAAGRRVTDCEGAVETAKQALAQAEKRLELALQQYAAADNAVDDAEERVAGVPERLVQLDELITKAGAVAMANARWAEREKLVAEVKRLDDDSKAKTTEIEKLRGEKEALLANAKFPIPGIGFGDGDVTFNGLPLEQTSGAERIRIGASLIAARNPPLRIMRVPEGEKLDETNLAALNEFCEQQDFQCTVERIGESGPATIIIRDGRVYEPPEPA